MRDGVQQIERGVHEGVARVVAEHDVEYVVHERVATVADERVATVADVAAVRASRASDDGGGREGGGRAVARVPLVREELGERAARGPQETLVLEDVVMRRGVPRGWRAKVERHETDQNLRRGDDDVHVGGGGGGGEGPGDGLVRVPHRARHAVTRRPRRPRGFAHRDRSEGAREARDAGEDDDGRGADDGDVEGSIEAKRATRTIQIPTSRFAARSPRGGTSRRVQRRGRARARCARPIPVRAFFLPREQETNRRALRAAPDRATRRLRKFAARRASVPRNIYPTRRGEPRVPPPSLRTSRCYVTVRFTSTFNPSLPLLANYHLQRLRHRALPRRVKARTACTSSPRPGSRRGTRSAR